MHYMIRGDLYAKITEFSVEVKPPVPDNDGNLRYAPSCPGIHISGIGLGRNGQPQRYTVTDMPALDDDEARRMWDAARRAGELDDWSDEEFVCDLHASEGLVAEFSTGRRLIARLIAAAQAAREPIAPPGGHRGARIALIPKERTKNGLPHLIPLPPVMVEWLAGRRAADKRDFLFTVEETAPANSTSKAMKEIIGETRAAGEKEGKEQPRWSAHDLRHTFKTHISALTLDDHLTPLVPDIISERCLNHVEGDTKKRYNHREYANEKAAAFRIWADELEKMRKAA